MPSQSRSARQLPRKRGSQSETFRLLPPTRAGEVARRAGEGNNKQCGGRPYSQPPPSTRHTSTLYAMSSQAIPYKSVYHKAPSQSTCQAPVHSFSLNSFSLNS